MYKRAPRCSGADGQSVGKKVMKKFPGTVCVGTVRVGRDRAGRIGQSKYMYVVDYTDGEEETLSRRQR